MHTVYHNFLRIWMRNNKIKKTISSSCYSPPWISLIHKNHLFLLLNEDHHYSTHRGGENMFSYTAASHPRTRGIRKTWTFWNFSIIFHCYSLAKSIVLHWLQHFNASECFIFNLFSFCFVTFDLPIKDIQTSFDEDQYSTE